MSKVKQIHINDFTSDMIPEEVTKRLAQVMINDIKRQIQTGKFTPALQQALNKKQCPASTEQKKK